MRPLAPICVLLVAPVIGFAATAGADDSHEYEIEMYNAFGIVQGSQVRIAGERVQLVAVAARGSGSCSP